MSSLSTARMSYKTVLLYVIIFGSGVLVRSECTNEAGDEKTACLEKMIKESQSETKKLREMVSRVLQEFKGLRESQTETTRQGEMVLRELNEFKSTIAAANKPLNMLDGFGYELLVERADCLENMIKQSQVTTKQLEEMVKQELTNIRRVQTGAPIVGPPGRPGPRGPPGTGLKGQKGEQGDGVSDFPRLMGPPGEPGLPGLMGPRGERGEPGKSGLSGRPGPVGFPGMKGDVGVQGYPGLMGPPGEKGEKGRSGMPGRPGRVVSQREKAEPEPISDGSGLQELPSGRSYTESEVRDICVGVLRDQFAKQIGATTTVSRPGPPGRPGKQGLPGVEGPPGEKGDPGFDGLPGVDGEPGVCNCY